MLLENNKENTFVIFGYRRISQTRHKKQIEKEKLDKLDIKIKNYSSRQN